MTCTRRDFLSSVAASAAAAGIGPLFPLEDDTSRRLGEFPLAPIVARFRADQSLQGVGFKPTRLVRDEYLRLIHGIAGFFAQLQDERGAILDPYDKKERQYSTPAFALAGAVLLTSGRGPEFLSPVVRAMQAACADLADGKAADLHADFFTVLLMHADRVLSSIVSAPVAAGWRRDLARVVPERVYRYQPGGQQLHNWNLVAAAGEFLRTRGRLGGSMRWVEASLARQVEHFTPSGMYRDPGDPMAYDHFARLWALDLTEEGYRGQHAKLLDECVERGAWASLFMQSPWGELPCGGRSSHHQWNEAEEAVTFETFARRLSRRGDQAAAGAFKRAARLSLRSIRRWVRPTGDLWIVKNRLDPALRHGYEAYSFHSQYNLLTAAMLALAWLRADDRIGEAPCPADTGGFAFSIQPAFHKVFAAASGASVEIDTGADAHYNVTGIVRIHHQELPPETLSDGVAADCSYQLPSRPTRSLALGPAWLGGDERWHGLAEHAGSDLDPVDFRLIVASRERVEIEMVYRGRLRGGATGIREQVTVAPHAIEVGHLVEGEIKAVRQTYPLLLSDGERQSLITLRDSAVELSRDGGGIAYEPLGEGVSLTRLNVAEPCRSGFMDAACAETPGRAIRCRATIRPGSR
jgi:hypothetical protein